MDEQYASVPAVRPANEAERLDALARYVLTDAPIEPLFDQLTAIGGAFFCAPICLITLIGETRQFIKSSFGVEMREATREDSFCAHALLEDQPMVVLDASVDARFATNVHVLGPAQIRFYAGAPILSSDGFKIGTFCLFDFSARATFEDHERASLNDFARLTSNLIEHRMLAVQIAQGQERLRASAERTHEILEGTIDSVILLNRQWEITFLNGKAAHLVGRRRDVLGINLWDAFPALLGTSFEHHLRQANRERIQIDFQDFYPGVENYFKVEVHPTTNGLAIFFRDVTVEHARHAAWRLHEERYRLATPSTRDGIWDWNLETGKAYFSASWQLIMGLPAEEFVGDISHWFQRFHPKDAARRDGKLHALMNGSDLEFESEYRVSHEDGTWHWVSSRGNLVRGPNHEVLRITGAISDITEHKCVDHLTGLHNRSCMLEHIEYRLDSNRPQDKVFAVLEIGIHQFKYINDSFGHREGDKVLIEIARRLEETLAGNRIQDGFAPATGTDRAVARKEDNTCLSVVARMRGVVFAILLGGVKHVEDVVTYANMLQLILHRPMQYEGQIFTVSASIGIAMCEGDYTSAERIVEDSGVAMHHTRNMEMPQPAVFSAYMRERTQRRLELESDLRHAVDENQLILHYQPEVVLGTGIITGFEALVRWRHPTRGMISPAEFIPHAEDSGLIVAIGQWTLGEAMRQLNVWAREGLVTPVMKMAVNLSTKQFQDRGLLRDIKKILEQEHAVAANLTLEITESALFGNMEVAKDKLEELRRLGIRLDLDDFGTGYSSLHYLHRLPFDSLKIDQSFVRSLEESEESSAIARSIIQLGASLKMAVIAEGVETARQRDHLIDLGCIYGQGYLFSKPLAASDLTQILRESAS